MMRSESRTDETSGLVTMIAASAWRMASIGAALDAGRAVADDPVELPAQLGDHPRDAVFGQGILVAGLRGGQQAQGLDPLVADQRLGKLGDALDDVDQVEHHAALGPEHEIEIAQADVEIDHDHFLARLRERGPERGGGGGLADAALAGRHDQDFGHSNLLRRAQLSAVISIALPLSHAWTGRPRRF